MIFEKYILNENVPIKFYILINKILKLWNI